MHNYLSFEYGVIIVVRSIEHCLLYAVYIFVIVRQRLSVSQLPEVLPLRLSSQKSISSRCFGHSTWRAFAMLQEPGTVLVRRQRRHDVMYR